jgi:hypothetical protein
MGVFVGFSRLFLLGILIFKSFTARRFYKSFGVKGLNTREFCIYSCIGLKVHKSNFHEIVSSATDLLLTNLQTVRQSNRTVKINLIEVFRNFLKKVLKFDTIALYHI